MQCSTQMVFSEVEFCNSRDFPSSHCEALVAIGLVINMLLLMLMMLMLMTQMMLSIRSMLMMLMLMIILMIITNLIQLIIFLHKSAKICHI